MTVEAAWWDRDVIRVDGPDAESFLQGQLSQDVSALEPGGSAWTLLLQPQGKVEAFLRITRVGEQEFVLDVDGGWGEGTVARLERFKLRVKAVVDRLDWRCLALRSSDGHSPVVTEAQAGVVEAACRWEGFAGTDLLGEHPEIPAGASLVDADVFERRRIGAGFPRMGADLDERTIPAEAGVVDVAVSFTKGCYTGQELVARIDSRGGNVPRHLRKLTITGAVPPGGAVLQSADGKDVGWLTSVAATDGGAIALGYVGRAVEVPAELTVVWEGGRVGAMVEALTPPTLVP